jgi:hypothetical protein
MKKQNNNKNNTDKVIIILLPNLAKNDHISAPETNPTPTTDEIDNTIKFKK